ncbi:MAG TPA: rod shape-determining protein MreC [Candidatus Paceibacterota bacterium]|nr:rod shape-determining protein MreC [Candidatus Paceibacterota bacterium]HPT40436.1 rod shape-determining protein MreC [Candidatus Paceibacterota bacterium]
MRKSPVKKIIFLGLVVIIGYFSFSALMNVSSAAQSNIAASLFNPFRGYILKVTDNVADFFSGVFSYRAIKEENEQLIFQNRSLKSLLNSFIELKTENESLREALNLASKQKLNFILADVISRSPLNFSQSFMIDKGNTEGIVKGQAVIWGGQVLVGEIKDTTEDSATIRSINDNEFRTSVFVGEKRIEAMFKGQGLEPAQLDLVSIKEEIKSGDRIITSGLDKKISRGLYIGEVKDVKRVEGKVFQTITVEPAFDWGQLEQVLIIK